MSTSVLTLSVISASGSSYSVKGPYVYGPYGENLKITLSESRRDHRSIVRKEQ